MATLKNIFTVLVTVFVMYYCFCVKAYTYDYQYGFGPDETNSNTTLIEQGAKDKLSLDRKTTNVDAQYDIEMERLINDIEYEYGVQINYIYNKENFFPVSWIKPPISAYGEQVDIKEVKRTIPIIKEFLSAYPKEVIQKNLTDIYLLNDMIFYNTEGWGGTNGSSGVYMTVQGYYSEAYILSTLHKEFSSILMRNYYDMFLEKEWLSINPPGFKYSGTGVEVLGEDNLLTLNEVLFTEGFLDKYAKSSLENDFNEFAGELFTNRSHLYEICQKYEKIRAKTQLVISFYLSINNKFDFSVK